MQVYLIRNTVNRRWYIGATTGTLAKRWKGHCDIAAAGVRTAMASAIRKYGKCAFTIDTLLDGLADEREMFVAEILAIALFRILETTQSYNMTAGGDGGAQPPEIAKRTGEKLRGRTASAETRAKMSTTAKRIGTGNWLPKAAFRGRKHTTASKDAMRCKAQERIGPRNGFFGKCHSAETRQQISETKIRNRRPLTDEQRQRLSDAVTAWWKNRKENQN